MYEWTDETERQYLTRVILQEKIDTFTIYDADKHISCLSSYHKTVYTQFNYFCELLYRIGFLENNKRNVYKLVLLLPILFLFETHISQDTYQSNFSIPFANRNVVNAYASPSIYLIIIGIRQNLYGKIRHDGSPLLLCAI